MGKLGAESGLAKQLVICPCGETGYLPLALLYQQKEGNGKPSLPKCWCGKFNWELVPSASQTIDLSSLPWAGLDNN